MERPGNDGEGTQPATTPGRTRGTSTSRFGVSRRESHDATDFYARFRPPLISDDDAVAGPFPLDEPLVCGDARMMDALPDGSVALVVTSPPYFAGKAYEEQLGLEGVPADYLQYLEMLRDVFAECRRVLEPGGRIAVNVANLGRKPYRSLAADVVRILQDDLGLLLRGEVIWAKAEGASGSCAWGSFRSAMNPVLRDITERVVIASKGRFDRARSIDQRRAEGLPSESSTSNDEFLEATLDLWRIPAESATRVGHPAPFPVELPVRLIDLYTFKDDLVLDPFLGSGTTAVAAARRGRRYAGYDTDAAYVDLARARVAADRASSAVPERDGFHDRATESGQGMLALAATVLEDAGFTVRAKRQAVPGLGINVDLVAEDAAGDRWSFDVTGAFTTTRAGLLRADTLWKSLGRAGVLSRRGIRPLVLLTSHLPAPRSAGDRALHELGPAGFFDAVEVLDPEGQARLARYAAGGHRDRAHAGFWTDAELQPPDEGPLASLRPGA